MNSDEQRGDSSNEPDPSRQKPGTSQVAFQITEQAQPPATRTGRTMTVCKTSEIPAGTGRIVQDEAISIGVFNLAGRFYAVQNLCPHQGAPLCRGRVSASFHPSEPPALVGGVLRCPWHGWEFDLVSGEGVHNLRSYVPTYEVRIDGDQNIVLLL